MNNELQKRLYEMEVMPPAAVWEKLSLTIDEINADNIIAKRIISAEILPPTSLWEKLSSSIDEMNADNIITKKVATAEVFPPASVWEKIKDSIGIAEEPYKKKKGRVINLRRLAAAAVFIGVIIAAWLLLRNNNTVKTDAIAESGKKIESKTTPDTNAAIKKDDVIRTDAPPPTVSIADANPQSVISKALKNKGAFKKNNNTIATPLTTAVEYASLKNEIPGEKSFDKPIDDLSLVTANQNYMTMVNSNGRLVKIPSELAQLAPHLQDKPLSEDIYEVMFGEGTYWKETMDEWRKKLLSAPVASGDAFTSFIELLKTIQSK